ncbi:hypothetical protein DFH27DRAFT_276197 [Peziza echinospora]|nr:hypothetical protein DFH27DRAFT_276197 [Peziza echinospora]
MTFGEAAGMERLQDTHNSTPHSAAPQLPEAGPLASSSGSQHVESGYSSMANSQIYPQSPQEAQARLQLQSIAQASQARVVNSLPSIIDSPPSPLTKPPGAHDHGVGGVGGGGGGGLGPAGTGGGEGRPKPPISHFAPQSSPAAHPAHTPNPPGQQEYTAAGSRAPAISPAAEDVPTTPTLPPIAGGAPSAPGSGGPALMTAPPSISPPKSTATLAGVKRTASGAVKTSALSVPNSPLEMLSPSALGVPASPRVDPSRIQEVCTSCCVAPRKNGGSGGGEDEVVLVVGGG